MTRLVRELKSFYLGGDDFIYTSNSNKFRKNFRERQRYERDLTSDPFQHHEFVAVHLKDDYVYRGYILETGETYIVELLDFPLQIRNIPLEKLHVLTKSFIPSGDYLHKYSSLEVRQGGIMNLKAVGANNERWPERNIKKLKSLATSIFSTDILTDTNEVDYTSKLSPYGTFKEIIKKQVKTIKVWNMKTLPKMYRVNNEPDFRVETVEVIDIDTHFSLQKLLVVNSKHGAGLFEFETFTKPARTSLNTTLETKPSETKISPSKTDISDEFTQLALNQKVTRSTIDHDKYSLVSSNQNSRGAFVIRHLRNLFRYFWDIKFLHKY